MEESRTQKACFQEITTIPTGISALVAGSDFCLMDAKLDYDKLYEIRLHNLASNVEAVKITLFSDLY